MLLVSYLCVKMRYVIYLLNDYRLIETEFLQCFDTVGWAAGRASGL